MKGPTPSTAAKSGDYRPIQGSDVPLLDGRLHDEAGYHTAAPPIEIYHPIFGNFSKNSKDLNLQIPEDVLRLTAAINLQNFSPGGSYRICESWNIGQDPQRVIWRRIQSR